jgi:glutamine cyclotransferase
MYISTEEGDTIFFNFWVNNQLWLTKNLFLTFSIIHVLPKTSKVFEWWDLVRLLASNTENSSLN